MEGNAPSAGSEPPKRDRSDRHGHGKGKHEGQQERPRDRDRDRDRRRRGERDRDRGRERDRDRRDRTRRTRRRRRSGSRSKSRSGSRSRRSKRKKIEPTSSAELNTTSHVSDPKLARTVYVGGVHPEITASLLQEFFEETVSKVPDRPPCAGSIVSNITVDHEKLFALMEFTTCFDAEIAICMDGAKFMGHPLEIRNANEKELAQANAISSYVEDGPDKIFLTGLPLHYSDEKVRIMVSQFGALKAFALVRDSKSKASQGFAFFSFKDRHNTKAACAGLHGRIIEGKNLVCHPANQKSQNSQDRSRTPDQQKQDNQPVGVHPSRMKPTQSSSPNVQRPNAQDPKIQHSDAQYSNAQHPEAQYPNTRHPTTQHPNVSHPNAQHPNNEHLNTQHSMNYRGGAAMNIPQKMGQRGSVTVSSHRGILAGGSAPRPGHGTGPPNHGESRILKLLNMVSRDELLNNEEYYDILLDIREECRCFGKLLRIFVPRPHPPRRGWRTPVPQHPDVGAIFVEYLTVQGARVAQDYIKGRKFNNREIIIQFMPEHIWLRMIKTEPALPS